MRPFSQVTLTLSLVFSFSAGAREGQLFVGPFTGPKKQAAASQKQLQQAVCAEVSCVGAKEVTTAGKPDWKKLQKRNVDAVLSGKLVKAGAKLSLELELHTRPGAKPHWKQRFAVAPNGRMLPQPLQNVVGAVVEHLPGSHASETELPAAAVDARPKEVEPAVGNASGFTTPAAAETPDVSAESGAVAEVSQRDGEENEPPSSSTYVDPAASSSVQDGETHGVGAELSPPQEGEGAFPVVRAELGLEFLNRGYALSNLQTANLRDYSAPLFVAPRLRVEAHPWGARGGALAGLGAELDFARSLGLKTSLGASASEDSSNVGGITDFPSAMSRFELNLLYALRPLQGSGLTVVPKLGFRKQSFSVGEADGVSLDGLPGISYSGVQAAVGLEWPFAEDAFVALAELGFLPSLSTGAIGQPPYFTSAKASGFEAQVGVGLRILPKMEARVMAQLTRYSLSFESAEEAEYVASGASDRYLGGALSALYRF